VLATIIHYVMNMFMTTRLIELRWSALIGAWVPGILLGVICLAAGWSIHTFCFWVHLPGFVTLATALILIPGVCILGVFAFPGMLGRGSNNPLSYLPQRLKQMKLIGNLISRIE